MRWLVGNGFAVLIPICAVSLATVTWGQVIKEGELSPAANDSFEQGQRDLEESRFEEAVVAFTKVIELYPEFADAYNARGAAYRGLASRQTDEREKERLFNRADADHDKAREIRTDERAAREWGRFRVSPLAMGLGSMAYFGAWGLLFYSWKAKRFPLVWPILGFFLCGPLSLLFMGLYALVADATPLPTQPEFADHPLEVELRKQPQKGAKMSEGENPVSTRACPTCGRINSATTRVCPTCEHRIT